LLEVRMIETRLKRNSITPHPAPAEKSERIGTAIRARLRAVRLNRENLGLQPLPEAYAVAKALAAACPAARLKPNAFQLRSSDGRELLSRQPELSANESEPAIGTSAHCALSGEVVRASRISDG
jgi:hypothetical protein